MRDDSANAVCNCLPGSSVVQTGQLHIIVPDGERVDLVVCHAAGSERIELPEAADSRQEFAQGLKVPAVVGGGSQGGQEECIPKECTREGQVDTVRLAAAVGTSAKGVHTLLWKTLMHTANRHRTSALKIQVLILS